MSVDGEDDTATNDNVAPIYKPDYVINNLQELLHLLPVTDNSGAVSTKKNGFRSTTGKFGARRQPYNRRVATVPDLDSGNSNSSDGS